MRATHESKTPGFGPEDFDPPAERLIIPAAGGLLLKQLFIDDAGPMLEAISYDRSHLSKFDDDTAKKYKTEQDIIDSIVLPDDPSRLRFGIWDGDTFVGSVNLQPRGERLAEIGYWLGAKYIGQDIAGKAAIAISDYAFANGYDSLFAKVYAANENFDEGNEASKRTLLKAGYRFEKLYSEKDEEGKTHWYWRFGKSRPVDNT